MLLKTQVSLWNIAKEIDLARQWIDHLENVLSCTKYR